MRLLTIPATVLALATPAPATAQGLFDGLFRVGQCGAQPGDTEMTISGTHMQFYETSCDLSNPTPVHGMGDATLYDVSCTGEGENWTARYLVMSDWDGGVILVQEGLATTFSRCSGAPAAYPGPAPQPAPLK